MQSLKVEPGHLTLEDLLSIHQKHRPIELDSSCFEGIHRATKIVDNVIEQDQTVYGINTGFGLLANTKIEKQELETLQRSVVLSHAAGVGSRMAPDTVRLLLLLKINSLARGFSGIRLEVIEALISLYNHQVTPCIPLKGSVGASGDLAPLAHMSALLLGEGHAIYRGEEISASRALEICGLQTIVLAPKEGLALLNGTQASTALALQGLFYAQTCLAAATVIGALSVEAARGSHQPFDARIHAARGCPSQIAMAQAYRSLLLQSEIETSHADCEKVQDPYSLRCQPQVMGACLTQIRNAADVLLIEANAVTDNPLVLTDSGDILSGGNFHAESVAMSADNMALAFAEIGALSERRIALLIDTQLSGLPPFLVEDGGVNSGFMIAQVTAASLASENKSLAHPASIDSMPTSANQEDHVSMAMFSARRLHDMYENTSNILAIEWLAASQGLDFLSPLKSSRKLESAKERLRAEVPFYDKDRYFAPDIRKSCQLIQADAVLDLVDPCILVANPR